MTPPDVLRTAYTTCLEVTTEPATGATWLHPAVAAKQQLIAVIQMNLDSPEVLTTHTSGVGGV